MEIPVDSVLAIGLLGLAACGLVWLSRRNRQLQAHREFVRQVAGSLFELGLDTEKLPPQLRRLYAAACSSLFHKQREPNPREAACEVFLLAVQDHPNLVVPALRYSGAEARVLAIELVRAWAAGSVSRRCADEFIDSLSSELRCQLVFKHSGVDASRGGESPAAALWS